MIPPSVAFGILVAAVVLLALTGCHRLAVRDGADVPGDNTRAALFCVTHPGICP